jgi:hypothetical protein
MNQLVIFILLAKMDPAACPKWCAHSAYYNDSVSQCISEPLPFCVMTFTVGAGSRNDMLNGSGNVLYDQMAPSYTDWELDTTGSEHILGGG